MNDKLWEIFLFIIWALGMLGTIVYFCYEDQSWVQGLLRLSTSLFIIASLLGFCYIRNIKSKYENADAKTVEKLEIISQQIADIRSTSSNNSEMYFLQSLAASIGDKGSNWETEQIVKFLQCMEFICKKEKQTSNGEPKKKPVNNGN